VNGDTGKIVDMKEYGLYESASVKIQILKTAIEVRAASFNMLLKEAFILFSQAARMLLRVDDVVQAVRKDQERGGGAQQGPGPEEMMEQ